MQTANPVEEAASTCRAYNFCEHAKHNLYSAAHASAKATVLTRLTGPLVGTISGVLTIASAVSNLGESIIRGLGNLLMPASLGDFAMGVCQIGSLPFDAVAVIISPLRAVGGIVFTTTRMFVSPESYTKERMEAHNIGKRSASMCTVATLLFIVGCVFFVGLFTGANQWQSTTR